MPGRGAKSERTLAHRIAVNHDAGELAASPLAGLPDLELLRRYDDRGRQEPADVAAISAATAIVADRLDSADSVGERSAALALLGCLDNVHRLLGETNEASRLLRCALAMARRT